MTSYSYIITCIYKCTYKCTSIDSIIFYIEYINLSIIFFIFYIDYKNIFTNILIEELTLLTIYKKKTYFKYCQIYNL